MRKGAFRFPRLPAWLLLLTMAVQAGMVDMGVAVDASKHCGDAIDTAKTNAFAYGPAITYADGRYRMFFCSIGSTHASLHHNRAAGLPKDTLTSDDWDYIRYTHSADGKSWSVPRIVLRPRLGNVENSDCDPSLIRHKGYYYLFFGGAVDDKQGQIYLARSAGIAGPYLKLAAGPAWEKKPAHPLPIVSQPEGDQRQAGACHGAPLEAPCRDKHYGVGQPIALKRGAHFELFFTRQIKGRKTAFIKWTGREGKEPWDWEGAAVDSTNMPLGAVDMVFDDASGRYVIYYATDQSAAGTSFYTITSADGITWDLVPKLLYRKTGVLGGNVGVLRDGNGHRSSRLFLMGYGAEVAGKPGANGFRSDLRVDGESGDEDQP